MGASVTVDHNIRDVSRRLVAFGERHMPYAIAKGINQIVTRAQAEERAVLMSNFTVRRKQFMERAIKIKPFATKETLEATIRVDPPGGQARADILTKFEDGGVKKARSGTLAVPIEARPSKTADIPKQLRPRELGLQGSGKVLRGKRGTYLIRNSSGGGTIFQRRGGGSLVLYTLKRAVPIEPRLKFVETITAVAQHEAPGAMRKAFFEALYSAK